MRKLFFFYFGLFCLSLATVSAGQISIVAVVNDDAITSLELDARVAAIKVALLRNKQPVPPDNFLRKQMLDVLIDERLILNFAREQQLLVAPEAVVGKIEQKAQSVGLKVEDYYSLMAKQANITKTQLQAEALAEILSGIIATRLARERVVVTDAEIDRFIAQNKRFGKTPAYQMANIVIAIPEGIGQTQRNKIIKQARLLRANLAKNPQLFGQYAKQYSSAGNKTNDGRLPIANLEELPDLYRRTVAKLDVGQVSRPLITADAVHIVMLIDRVKMSFNLQQSVLQHQVQGIFIQVDATRSDLESKSQIEALHGRLLNGADFGVLARQFSLDLYAPSGGNWGWVYPGDREPVLEQALAALAIDQVSEPIRGIRGWYLLKLLARRSEPMEEERLRSIVHDRIQLSKSEPLFADWLRRQQAVAFIEKKIKFSGTDG